MWLLVERHWRPSISEMENRATVNREGRSLCNFRETVNTCKHRDKTKINLLEFRLSTSNHQVLKLFLSLNSSNDTSIVKYKDLHKSFGAYTGPIIWVNILWTLLVFENGFRLGVRVGFRMVSTFLIFFLSILFLNILFSIPDL